MAMSALAKVMGLGSKKYPVECVTMLGDAMDALQVLKKAHNVLQPFVDLLNSPVFSANCKGRALEVLNTAFEGMPTALIREQYYKLTEEGKLEDAIEALIQANNAKAFEGEDAVYLTAELERWTTLRDDTRLEVQGLTKQMQKKKRVNPLQASEEAYHLAYVSKGGSGNKKHNQYAQIMDVRVDSSAESSDSEETTDTDSDNEAESELETKSKMVSDPTSEDLWPYLDFSSKSLTTIVPPNDLNTGPYTYTSPAHDTIEDEHARALQRSGVTTPSGELSRAERHKNKRLPPNATGGLLSPLGYVSAGLPGSVSGVGYVADVPAENIIQLSSDDDDLSSNDDEDASANFQKTDHRDTVNPYVDFNVEHGKSSSYDFQIISPTLDRATSAKPSDGSTPNTCDGVVEHQWGPYTTLDTTQSPRESRDDGTLIEPTSSSATRKRRDSASTKKHTPHTLTALVSPLKYGVVQHLQFGDEIITAWVSVDDLTFCLYSNAQYERPYLKIHLSTITRVVPLKRREIPTQSPFSFSIEYVAQKRSLSASEPAVSGERVKKLIYLICESQPERKWWIEALIMSKAIKRSWNDEFQNGVQAYRVAKRKAMIQRSALMNTFNDSATRILWELEYIANDFATTARIIAQIIVDELSLPLKNKTILPVQVGGVAGGDKYISHGILFKFSIDKGYYGGDEFAMKATAHEARGMTGYIYYSLASVFPHTLSFPLFFVLDYKGYRLSACSLLPINNNTLVYGSADSGRTVHASDEAMNALMKKAARELNLKPHWVVEKRKIPANTEPHREFLAAPGDIEGHLGMDGRYYVLDTARVFPPQVPTNATGAFLYQLLRPEYVRSFAKPLCPDAFCGWGHDPRDPTLLLAHNTELREATEKLTKVVIPEFATCIDYHAQERARHSKTNANAVQQGRVLVILMHLAGINIRYMGLLRKYCKNVPIRQHLLGEMIARVIKNKLRCRLRQAARTDPQATQRLLSVAYSHIFSNPYNMFGDHPESIKNTLNIDIIAELDIRFPGALTEEEHDPSYDFIKAGLSVALICATCSTSLGLIIAGDLKLKLWQREHMFMGIVTAKCTPERQANQYSEKRMRKYPLDKCHWEAGITEMVPQIVQLPFIAFVAAQSYTAKSEAPGLTTLQRDKLLTKARNLFLSGLEGKTDSVWILPRVAQMFITLAKLRFEQAKELAQKIEEVRKDTSEIPRFATFKSRGFDPRRSGIATYMLKQTNHEIRSNPLLMKNLDNAIDLNRSDIEQCYQHAAKQYVAALNLDPCQWRVMMWYADFLQDVYPERTDHILYNYRKASSIYPHDPDLQEKLRAYEDKVRRRRALHTGSCTISLKTSAEQKKAHSCRHCSDMIGTDMTSMDCDWSHYKLSFGGSTP
eukprot:TRINITY_DN2581_c1_g2_i1.p1 TRINITY_DN2581_c1_g2~~TRINITY_DN2581_c1_g2_i1.p1  ORF type:complete len:1535 (+),score=206.50 TRINITY_DN2581_c1_g2_i1:470-4606(+)